MAKTAICSSKSVRSNRTTKLEALPNELLLNLFEYLSAIHLLCAFGGLNSHFESLLFAHISNCHLDFRLVSKRDSQLIFRRYLPLIRHRITSIRLSDTDYSLKHTSLLPSEWSHMHNLTHLKLINCHNSFQHKSNTYLSNRIRSLPKLTHCCVDTGKNAFYMPTKLSSSIECVSILGHHCRLNELTRLLENTPRLRSLCIQHRDLNDDQYVSLPISSIATLKLYDLRSRLVMMNLFQTMLNLSHLTVETFYIRLDGHQWEEMIVQHLPKLRVFRLKMEVQFTHEQNNEQQVDQLLDSFRSLFWLEERQWFVRCHWRQRENHSDILLYTMPLTFRDVNTDTMRFSYKTTCPGNKNNTAIAVNYRRRYRVRKN